MVDGYKTSETTIKRIQSADTANNSGNTFFSALESVSESSHTNQRNGFFSNQSKSEASNFQEILQKRKEQESKVGKLKCKVIIKVNKITSNHF